MQKLLKIVFSKKSTSKGLKEALRLANKLNAGLEGDSVVIELTVTDVFNLWENVKALLNIVDKWRSFEIYYRGRLCVINKEYRKLFYSIQEIRQCYHAMQDDPIDFEKCNDGWGCDKITSVSLDLISFYKKWYQFGYLMDDNTWIIDKARILAEVETEIASKFLTTCPAFPMYRIKKIIFKMENSITLDENWDVIYEMQLIKGVPTEVAVSIEYCSGFKTFNYYTNSLLKNLKIDPENKN